MFVIIVLFILFIIILNKSNFTSDHLYNGDKWNNYRIGDVITYGKNTDFYNLNKTWNILYHIKDYPGSIASEYIKQNTTGKAQNIELLKKIINEKETNPINISDNTLVLHIRVGDVLCVNFEHDPNAINNYSKKDNSIWWDDVKKYIKYHGINTVIILSGTHFKGCLDESVDYIKDRIGFLKNDNVTIETRLGKSPDEDLVFCKNAKHYISTGGGFGKLINLIKK